MRIIYKEPKEEYLFLIIQRSPHFYLKKKSVRLYTLKEKFLNMMKFYF